MSPDTKSADTGIPYTKPSRKTSGGVESSSARSPWGTRLVLDSVQYMSVLDFADGYWSVSPTGWVGPYRREPNQRAREGIRSVKVGLVRGGTETRKRTGSVKTEVGGRFGSDVGVVGHDGGEEASGVARDGVVVGT